MSIKDFTSNIEAMNFWKQRSSLVIFQTSLDHKMLQLVENFWKKVNILNIKMSMGILV
jgi:hypothetical protein